MHFKIAYKHIKLICKKHFLHKFSAARTAAFLKCTDKNYKTDTDKCIWKI